MSLIGAACLRPCSRASNCASSPGVREQVLGFVDVEARAPPPSPADGRSRCSRGRLHAVRRSGHEVVEDAAPHEHRPHGHHALMRPSRSRSCPGPPAPRRCRSVRRRRRVRRPKPMTSSTSRMPCCVHSSRSRSSSPRAGRPRPGDRFDEHGRDGVRAALGDDPLEVVGEVGRRSAAPSRTPCAPDRASRADDRRRAAASRPRPSGCSAGPTLMPPKPAPW